MAISKIVIASVIIGILAALVTGAVNSTPAGLLGTTWYGFPVTWISKVVINPSGNPWKLDTVGLIADTVFWFVIVLALMLIEYYFKSRKPKPETATRPETTAEPEATPKKSTRRSSKKSTAAKS
jgi:hypothetical protein